MTELSVATTINPRFDHVTPIEATQSSVTITHRCHVFAELMAIARSGLVDIVLIADDFELVGLETLQQVLNMQGHGPKVAAISDVVEDRQRLSKLGIPVASPTSIGSELVEWLHSVHQESEQQADPLSAFTPRDLEILEQLDPDTPAQRRSGRRAAPYDPARDIPKPEESSAPPLSDTPRTDKPQEDVYTPHDVSSSEYLVAAEKLVINEEDATTLMDQAPERGSITAVWGPVGAPGVTTVAVNLAVESALEGHQTLLIDANTYGAAVAVHLGMLDDTAAIAQACRAIEHRGASAVDLGNYVQTVNAQRAEFDVITGLTRSERWPQLRTAAWEHLLDTARTGWDHIVIDCGFGLEEDEELSFDIPAPQRNATTLSAVKTADTIVAVGTGDPVGLGRFMKGLEQLTEISAQQVVPVINKVTGATSGVGPKRQLTTVWERFGPQAALQHFIPWAPETIAAALFEGKALAERAPKTEVRLAIRRVLESCRPAAAGAPPRQKTIDRVRPRWSLRSVVAQVKQRVGRGQ